MLVSVAKTLNVGNENIVVKVYDLSILAYVKINQVVCDTESIVSLDKYSINFIPSIFEGSVTALVYTESGQIEIPLNYLSKYKKEQNKLDCSIFYPEGMFKFNFSDEKKNAKTAEILAKNDLFNRIFDEFSQDKIPIANLFYPYYSSYCSNQLIGLSFQLAILQYLSMPTYHETNYSVLWTTILNSVGSIDNLFSIIPATVEDGTLYVASNALLDDDVVDSGIVLSDEVISYGANCVLSDNSGVPSTYNSFTIPPNRKVELKNGATQYTEFQLQFVSSNFTLYVGSSSDVEILPLSNWKDIQGLPVNQEVIYDLQNVDISDLVIEFIVPNISLIQKNDIDIIALFNSKLTDIKKIAIKFDGTDFKIKISKNNIKPFGFEGNEENAGYDEGVFQ